MPNASEVDLHGLHDRAYVRKFLENEVATTRRFGALLARIDLPAGARVLDVGCGSGALALALAGRIAEYDGVDFSEPFIDAARRRAARLGIQSCRFHCSDAIAFIDSQGPVFDLIFALDLSEHVPDAEWAAMVSAFKRGLKEGGQVLLHTPNLDFFIERMKQHNYLFRQFPEHVAVRTRVGNAAFFKNAGFSRVRCEFFPHYNFLRILHPASRLPVVGKYLAARLVLIATR
jgi:cyclopropane fatty-acyl-phospholipid synthase-like methyltransferase